MTITDYWLNPIDPLAPSVTALGFREDLEEFPHDLYSFFSSSIREFDIQNVRLLWRFLQGMQQQWESTYGKILNLPLLFSPDFCPEELLDYLGTNIGITSPDMDYLWGELTTIEKRRLLGIFVQALQLRCTDSGIVNLLEAMTGRYAEIREFFDYRWIISGDSLYQMETALGFEDNPSVAGDPWLVSEDSMPVGYPPDFVYHVNFGGGIGQYMFYVDSLMDAIVDPPVPPNPQLIRITYRPTKESCLGVVDYFPIPDKWVVLAPVNFYFGQTALPYDENLQDFRVSCENDPYTFDIRIMNDGSINRNIAIALARFSRPISERIYIRYLWLIEHFDGEALDNWTSVAGTVTHDTDTDTVTLGNALVESRMRSNVYQDSDWTNYSFGVRAQMPSTNKSMYMRLFWQDDQNYLELGIVPLGEGHAIAANWTLTQVVAGVPGIVTSGTLDTFDLDVNYYFRIVAFVSQGNIIFRGYQDENLFGTITWGTPWADTKGKIEVAVASTGSLVVKDVEVHPYPMDSDYVGP